MSSRDERWPGAPRSSRACPSWAFPASRDPNGDVVVQLFAGDGTFNNPVVAGQFSFAIGDFPVLANVGGAVSGRPDGFPVPLVIARLDAGND